MMVAVRFHGRRVVVCLLLVVAALGVYHLLAINSLADVSNRFLLSPAHMACQHPILDVKNPEIYRFFHHLDPIQCSEEPNWVLVKGSQATITPQARAAHGDVECSFTELLRAGDDNNRRGLTTTTHDTFTLTNTDFYTVFCTAKDGKQWENTIAGIRHDEDLRSMVTWNKVPDDALKLNFLMLGFDSLSHNTFIRTLPKTYAFLTDTLGSHVMEGYNIVGDGTPQQLIPILTGKTELELPETRRRMGEQAQYVNTYPFIWNDFKKNGYVTLYAEDLPHVGTFQYRLRGFDSPPTDHYMRPFYVTTYPEFHNHPKLCLKATPRHKVFFNYVYDFMNEYKKDPKFAFAFHGELSHDDYNLVSVADQDLVEMLTSLWNDGHLNNTILVLMSDHGHRFTTIRGTQQGKQEERLPFMSFYLPPALKTTYPSAADNVRMNIHRLTTPFDLYPTMQDILHFSGARLGQATERSISLFSQVPASRTCADAFIEPHWCACLTWEAVSIKEDRVQRAAHALVHYINTYTAPQRSLCHELIIHKITWAGKLLPTKGLLSFKKNADVDGFVPDMTDETQVTEVVYQVHVLTVPGQAHFEASLSYNIRQDTFSVKIEDVSRTNKYGEQAHCIMNTFPNLRKFCFCREPPPPPPPEKT
ncbi:uncharacterized protein LOC121854141 isoform X2 [Homarus americanus]|uniref:uncharacterized protein LOC121854141 isoform X2 n=1 Tax=Homarus americanus TaxID=6706 RepID=UPI001C446B9D|nr:uncharacterized protein LOC121854141 isoform X2 [Homarus americanus]